MRIKLNKKEVEEAKNCFSIQDRSFPFLGKYAAKLLRIEYDGQMAHLFNRCLGHKIKDENVCT